MTRTLLALATLTAATACGQTGSLYLPDEQIETPVEIRVPADDDKKEEKAAEPPAR